MYGKPTNAVVSRVQRRKNWLYPAACILCVFVIAVLLLLPGREAPGFVPPPFEISAISGVPEVPKVLGWSELNVREGLVVWVCGLLFEQEGQVPVWLYSEPENDCWLKLRLLDAEGNILGETGLIKPGEHIQNLTLDTIPKSETTVILKVMGYEPETYYSSGSVSLQTTLYPPK